MLYTTQFHIFAISAVQVNNGGIIAPEWKDMERVFLIYQVVSLCYLHEELTRFLPARLHYLILLGFSSCFVL